MRYNIIMVVTITTGYWHVMSRSLVAKYWCFGATLCLEEIIPLLHPEDVGGRFSSKMLLIFQTTHCHILITKPTRCINFSNLFW